MDAPESSEKYGRFRKRLPLTNTTLKYTEIAKKFPENHDVDEEMRVINQARLARKLRRELAERFLNKGKPSSAYRNKSSGPGRWSPEFVDRYLAPGELKMLEELMVVKLDGVSAIHPIAGLGTLEVHHNRCVYTASDIRMEFMSADLKGCSWLSKHEYPPLLIFHFRIPIMMGTKETKDIQFVLNHNRNEDLKNFVNKVKDTHSNCRSGVPITFVHFHRLEECEFDGIVATGKSTTFALACSALVVLVGPPFTVIPLGDIEIVNLSLHQPGMIHMAVVFKDFNCVVLEVRSIPLKLLTDIKDRLDHANVKYYVNCEDRDWNMTVRNIVESPETFIRVGGWEALSLEDSRTLAYYPIADSVLDKNLAENYVIW